MENRAKMSNEKLGGCIAIGGVNFSVGGESYVILAAGNGDGSIKAVGYKRMIEGLGRFAESEIIVKIPIKNGRERSESAVVEDGRPSRYNNKKDHDQICGQSRDAPRSREQLKHQREEKIDCRHDCDDSEGAQARNQPESRDDRTSDASELVRATGPPYPTTSTT